MKGDTMDSYKFNNGYSDHVVNIPTECKRFHSHKAFERVVVKENQTDYDLWSYATHIATIEVTNSGDTVAWISPMFDCSTSTIHQLSRWLREHEFGFSYYDCKYASTHGGIYNPNDKIVIYITAKFNH